MQPSWIFACFLFFTLFHENIAFPFVSLIPLSGALIAFVVKDQLECLVRECCTKSVWFNQTSLNYSLHELLHGQHIVTERVLHHLSAHILDRHPAKALALSFHGYTGVGKNFVSSLVANSLFQSGTKSRFFHFYDATIHFAHRSKIEEYKTKLQQDLRDAVTTCPYSLFVFDEMHTMSNGILDVIAPLLDFRDSVDGIDFRRSIFLFLSNAGGNAINRLTYDHLMGGKKRSELHYTDLDRVITRSAFNDEGGLRHSKIIEKHLITAMIPFLPMQSEHVRLCIRDVARVRDVPFTEDMAQFVLQELEWSPEGTQLFSVAGCKRVYEKVAFYLQQLDD